MNRYPIAIVSLAVLAIFAIWNHHHTDAAVFIGCGLIIWSRPRS